MGRLRPQEGHRVRSVAFGVETKRHLFLRRRLARRIQGGAAGHLRPETGGGHAASRKWLLGSGVVGPRGAGQADSRLADGARGALTGALFAPRRRAKHKIYAGATMRRY